MKTKTVYIEAWQNGERLQSWVVKGKKHKRKYLLEAMEIVRDKGGTVRETENLKVWQPWIVYPGHNMADRGQPVYTDWTPFKRE